MGSTSSSEPKEVALEPKCTAALKSSKLTKDQFEGCVRSKMNAVLIKAAKKDLMLQETTLICITNVVNSIYKLLPFNDSATSMKYHKEQQILFEHLKNSGLLGSSYTINEKGYIGKFHQSSYFGTAEVLDVKTHELCDILDGITALYIHELEHAIPADISQGGTSRQAEIRKLSSVTELIKEILVGRLVAVSDMKYDLLRGDSYGDWKKHMWVIASYAGMLVILEMCHVRLGGTFFK